MLAVRRIGQRQQLIQRHAPAAGVVQPERSPQPSAILGTRICAYGRLRCIKCRTGRFGQPAGSLRPNTRARTGYPTTKRLTASSTWNLCHISRLASAKHLGREVETLQDATQLHDAVRVEAFVSVLPWLSRLCLEAQELDELLQLGQSLFGQVPASSCWIFWASAVPSLMLHLRWILKPDRIIAPAERVCKGYYAVTRVALAFSRTRIRHRSTPPTPPTTGPRLPGRTIGCLTAPSAGIPSGP